jgi:hypothetical protein
MGRSPHHTGDEILGPTTKLVAFWFRRSLRFQVGPHQTNGGHQVICPAARRKIQDLCLNRPRTSQAAPELEADACGAVCLYEVLHLNEPWFA